MDPVETLLRPLDEDLLTALLAAAAAGAEPGEVMPPVPGPPGWNAERRAAFREFHRSRTLSARPVERTWVVLVGGTVAGAARLAPVPGAPGEVEAGLWLGRPFRGAGVGSEVLWRLVELAAADGFAVLVATTTTGNTAMRRVLAALGAETAEDGGAVTARLGLTS